MNWTKIKWNKTNSMVLAMMILVVAGIGKNKLLYWNVQQQQVKESENATQEPMQDQDIDMDVNKKMIVHVAMDTYGGSGVIIKILEDDSKMLIASSKHLLEDASLGTVVIDENEYAAKVTYLSEQYDLGFLEISLGEENRDVITKLQPVHFPASQQEWKECTYLGTDVYQYSSMHQQEKEINQGYITGYDFILQFNHEMLITKCHANAGMSGGAVFDQNGVFLGMISGGADPNESDETYSLSSMIIKEELENYLINGPGL